MSACGRIEGCMRWDAEMGLQYGQEMLRLGERVGYYWMDGWIGVVVPPRIWLCDCRFGGVVWAVSPSVQHPARLVVPPAVERSRGPYLAAADLHYMFNLGASARAQVQVSSPTQLAATLPSLQGKRTVGFRVRIQGHVCSLPAAACSRRAALSPRAAVIRQASWHPVWQTAPTTCVSG